MPTYSARDAAQRPGWSELHSFSTVLVPDSLTIVPQEGREAVMVTAGEISAILANGGGRLTLRRNDWIDVPPGGVTLTRSAHYWADPPAEVVTFRGTWSVLSDVCIFVIPVGGSVEMHYHDFHEYWLVLRGRATCETEGSRYAVDGPTIVATRMGYEHGLDTVEELIEGIGVETEPHGRKRMGHLHRSEHGDPEPVDLPSALDR